MTNQVAATILAQLGGNKFAAITGAKNFVGTANTLSFKIGKNNSKANHVRITLNEDLYIVEFSKVTTPKFNKNGELDDGWKVIKTCKGVFNRNLQETFTRVTGLYTSL